MLTTNYTITAVEQTEGEDQYYLYLTRKFGPLTYETVKDLNIGDEMSIQIAFPGDVQETDVTLPSGYADAQAPEPVAASQMTLFPPTDTEDDGA